MDESEKPRGVPGSRSTLKLKSPVTRSAPPPAAPPAAKPPPRHQDASNWADEHKHRMQADMDALSSGHAAAGPPSNRQRRR
jgi:hypothetical protein